MTTEVKTNAQIGPGFLGILTLIFITLKLTGYISWSWLWVLAPLWVPLAIVLTIFVVIGAIWLIYLGASAVNEANSKRKWRKNAALRRSNAMNK